jgi:hypothetical protein
MIVPLPPLDAYRADLAGAPGLDSFGADDGTWLLTAELLTRRARVRRGRRMPQDALAAIDGALTPLLHGEWAAQPGDAGSGGDAGPSAPTAEDPAAADAALAASALSVAERVEAAGALNLAFAMLVALADATPGASARTHGLVLAQRARIARKLGFLDAADALYGSAARAGRASGDADLVVRAMLGRGVLARIRGNYPDARVRFRRALRASERAGLASLASMAHHGLLIAASVAGDVDTALQHGWAAWQLAGDDVERQADLLATLAAAASDAGYDAAALRAYLGAAARSPMARLRLPALGGAALSAARVGDRGQLEAITRDLEHTLAREALPYERAQALTLLAEGWALAEPTTRGEPFASRARSLAVNGYHELLHQLDALATPARPAPPDAGRAPTLPTTAAPRATRVVVRALEALDLPSERAAGAHASAAYQIGAAR